ncbi:Glycine--tRNA ligase isoform X2 [Oopsacas minuta]|uniref:glycine--tRNA ligase n=1 Tax=Oopsacas minuta TaxID=111878 RepID=A0AAV7JW71_9METZ|nr:Glycine--tRNA ligase isoform X2 [Oopsacas minuta]
MLVIRQLFQLLTPVHGQLAHKLLYSMAEKTAGDLTGADPEIALAPYRTAVKQAGLRVQQAQMNAQTATGATKLDLQTEFTQCVSKLRAKQKELQEAELKMRPKQSHFDRSKLEQLLKRRFFYASSFPLYPSVAGLFDYGPMGCALKANLLSEWRRHFVLAEQMLEVDCTVLTPEPILRASGHVDKFTDYMVHDTVTGECFRADHLLEASLERVKADKKTTEGVKKRCDELLRQIDNLGKEELRDVIMEFNITSPSSGKPLSEPTEFNLMFPTSIGPSKQVSGYLRPETAQGIFVNFKRLLEFNGGKLPFAAAQIGQAFRNEISPGSGLLRVREFTLAEIEHFVDPTDKTHPKFLQIADTELSLFSGCSQMEGGSAQRVSIGEAVETGLVANQTLGYFMARIHLFLLKVGADSGRLRFRQHLNNEMAHYATDCWDAELLTSYGWIECVGCADRSCYDLNAHAIATKKIVSAKRPLPAPVFVESLDIIPNKQEIGKIFKSDSKVLLEHLNSLELCEMKQLEGALKNGPVTVTLKDLTFQLEASMVHFKSESKMVHHEEYTPGVIEPSFGIGRILYAILEHNFQGRKDDENRNWLSLPSCIAPCACSILPISSNEVFQNYIQQITSGLTDAGVTHKVDDSGGSIGRRYARTDEIAIPFGITIDFDTLKYDSVTMRERNSMKQVRIPLYQIPEVAAGLIAGRLNWAKVCEKYPMFTGQESSAAKDDDS